MAEIPKRKVGRPKGGKNPNAGRKPNPLPKQSLVLSATAEEKRIIEKYLSTRQRVVALLEYINASHNPN